MPKRVLRLLSEVHLLVQTFITADFEFILLSLLAADFFVVFRLVQLFISKSLLVASYLSIKSILILSSIYHSSFIEVLH